MEIQILSNDALYAHLIIPGIRECCKDLIWYHITTGKIIYNNRSAIYGNSEE